MGRNGLPDDPRKLRSGVEGAPFETGIFALRAVKQRFCTTADLQRKNCGIALCHNSVIVVSMTTREVEKPPRYPGIRQAKIVVRSPGTGKYFRVLVEEIRKGVPSKIFVETAKRMGLGQEELARKLGLKPRTIASRLASREKKLNPNESERVLRIKQIFDQAVQVFGSEEQAREWLMNTAYGLEGQRPIDLMDTEPGSSQVREYLGAIAQGNYW